MTDTESVLYNPHQFSYMQFLWKKAADILFIIPTTCICLQAQIFKHLYILGIAVCIVLAMLLQIAPYT